MQMPFVLWYNSWDKITLITYWRGQIYETFSPRIKHDITGSPFIKAQIIFHEILEQHPRYHYQELPSSTISKMSHNKTDWTILVAVHLAWHNRWRFDLFNKDYFLPQAGFEPGIFWLLGHVPHSPPFPKKYWPSWREPV